MSRSVGILFDLDGTLLDTAPEFATCMNRVLTEENKPLITTERLRPAVSYGAKGMVALALNAPMDDPNLEALSQRFLNYYAEDLGFETDFFAGIQDLLDAIEQANIPWGIVTNKSKLFTLPLLQRFPRLHRAAAVVSGDTLKVNKPSPEPLLLAANQLDVPATSCWYIGDAKTDVEASRAAGMRSAVANYGYIPPEQDQNTWNADHYINHPDELLKLVIL